MLDNHNDDFSLSVYLSVLRASAFRFYQNQQGGTKQVGAAGALRSHHQVPSV